MISKTSRGLLFVIAALFLLLAAGCGNSDEAKPAGGAYYDGPMKNTKKKPDAATGN